MTKGLKSAKGSDCNKVSVGGVTELYGDPEIQIEKPYTIVLGPGFDVEISRTTDGDYWVHVATRQATPYDPEARIEYVRVDAYDRYCDEANEIMQKETLEGGVNHVAFRIAQG